MERCEGIEPSLVAWKATDQPMTQQRLVVKQEVARAVGIEPTSSELEADVLPLNYTDIVANRTGLEPATTG